MRTYGCTIDRKTLLCRRILGCFPPESSTYSIHVWLAERTQFQPSPPLSWQQALFHSNSHTALPGGEKPDITTDVVWGDWNKDTVLSVLLIKPMASYTGLRSCTWIEFPAHVFNNSSFGQESVTSSCDLTLLTCLLIGSYRFCIIPLLSAFNGKHKKLWKSKWDWQLTYTWGFCGMFIYILLTRTQVMTYVEVMLLTVYLETFWWISELHGMCCCM